MRSPHGWIHHFRGSRPAEPFRNWRSPAWLDNLARDVSYGLRMLLEYRKNQATFHASSPGPCPLWKFPSAAPTRQRRSR